MNVVEIGRRESREAVAELQYPRATVPWVLFTSAREAEDRRLGL
jgi:hypothetical protein